MKAAYGKFQTMRRNEAFVAFVITFAAIALYSAWGSYLLHSAATSPQVITVER